MSSPLTSPKNVISLEINPSMARLLGESNSPSPAAFISTAALNSNLFVFLFTLLCALIFVLGLILAFRYVWLPGLAAGSREGSSQSPVATANKGLKRKVIQSLPKLTFSPDYSSSSSDECAICLTEFSVGDEIRILPRCGHRFHVSCVDTWFGSHSSCPSCRQILVVATCHKCGGLPRNFSSEPGSKPEMDIRINVLET